MAIKAKILKKPLLWLSLQPGGNLELKTHYFIGFQTFGKGYYSWAFSEASEEVSITPTSGYQKIKIEWWLDGGDITSIADGGGGYVTITTASPHGRSNGDSVDIRGTTDYDGTYTISNVTTNTFDIQDVFTSSQTGKWFADVGTEIIDSTVGNYYGKATLALKWDFYSMKDPTTGEYYKWLNQNDPNVSTYNSYLGHPRWGMRFDMLASDPNYDYRVVDDYMMRYAQDYTKLYDETKYHCYSNSYYFYHPQISHNYTLYPLANRYKNLKNNLLIYFEKDQTYTTNDLVNALNSLSSPYTDYFSVNMQETGSVGWKGMTYIELYGTLFGYDSNFSGTMNLTFNYTHFTIIGGGFFNKYDYYHAPRTINMNQSSINLIKLQAANWVAAYINMVNSVQNVINSDIILDFYNLTSCEVNGIGHSKTFYNKVAGGIRNIGGTPGDNRLMQWRYQRATDGASHLSDVYFENYYLWYVDDGSISQTTGYITNVQFHNLNSSPHLNFDVQFDYYYIDTDIDKIMVCKNVTSDRNDGQVILHVFRVSNSYNIKDIWKFYYDINLKVNDEQGNPIENATIKVTADSESDIGTTDSSGSGSVEFLGYTETYEHTADGYPYVDDYFTTSNWNEVILEITAPGYRKYTWKGYIKENVNWEITLQKSKNLNMSNVIKLNEV